MSEDEMLALKRVQESRINFQYKIKLIAGNWRGSAIIDVMEELIKQQPFHYRSETTHIQMFYSNVWDCLHNLHYDPETMLDSLLGDLRTD